MTREPASPRPASLAEVVVTIGGTVALLAMSVVLYGADSSQGANQIALVIGAILASGVGIRRGHRWQAIEQNIVAGISAAMPAILILFAVGSLIGIWILSGAVPTLIYYGLLVLDPAFFYAAACLLCAVVALAIGSSWTVAGTLGVALIAAASALELSIEITAGAIISGAYFGDKLSPLSDTTNLAPAATGVDLITHIRHMIWTTAPSLLIALSGFTALGLLAPSQRADAGMAETLAVLERTFAIGPLMLIPVLVVIILAARKTPALAAILAGVAAGILFAVLFQQDAILALTAGPEPSSSSDPLIAIVTSIWTVLFGGYTAATGDADLDALLSRGGMRSMLTTVWLIITAMTLGAALEKAGVLERLLELLIGLGRSTGALISATLATCFGMNVLVGDQYMAIVIPGRMFRLEYARRGLHPKNLSRALEDAGTLTSPLVPWNTCGAYMAATLGVPTLAYLPFCLFNLVNPVISAIYGFTGFKIAPLGPPDAASTAGAEPRSPASPR